MTPSCDTSPAAQRVQDASGTASPDSLDLRLARHVRSYRCRCGNRIFFRNTLCLACHSPLGYVPDDGWMVALDPGPDPGTWRTDGRNDTLKFCANRDSPAVCNWMTEAHNVEGYCVACRLNRTVPNLAEPGNAEFWGKLEIAKRRVISELLAFGLPVRSKVDEDPQAGLMFDMLGPQPGGAPVMTGHADGLITLNIEEADDARRESIKHQLHEPYRTLLGHFRHEIGHYYWDRLVRDTHWLGTFREQFGDERADYAEGLRRNYEDGPPPNWAASYVSAYATSHPWEDWAETWAHYMHMVDSLGTATGFGISASRLQCEITPFTRDDLYDQDDPEGPHLLALLNGWVEIVTVLNELSRSMGVQDFYPFVMSRPVVAKLHVIHRVIHDAQAKREI